LTRRAALLLALAASALTACADGPARPETGAPPGAVGGSAPVVSFGGTARAYYGHVR